MGMLGNGLHVVGHYEDALSVYEARLSTLQRDGDDPAAIICVQGNIATTYQFLGRKEQALRMRRDVYSGCLKLYGEEHEETLREAVCYSSSFMESSRYAEAKALTLKVMPVARRFLGENHLFTLQVRKNYAKTLYRDDDATLDDLREAVATLDELARTAVRVLGGAHPTTRAIEYDLRTTRAALRAREAGERVVFIREST